MSQAIQSVQLTPRVEALLTAGGLPVSDLRDGAVTLFAHVDGDRLEGVVGLEIHGPSALLRSLAVAEGARGTGLGAALVAHAERHATAQGVRTVYLLTTSAAAFFARHGYRHADRGLAPAAIAATPQFAGLCPASSAFMSKVLAAH
ncbi:arsenic resistance N-acetyltransferase ArsN2 [Luteimonas deserti]|uniref:GNAT family N-acetyltransferase n=1 Tax=Luteimonas deserti TaxID=2752306 RepID=A0A7Z0QNI7_9GAMM|nr:arsenic resistance N-acetyltransferase ArsN2 [Luteimonas deserti]NYZ61869.1 GNAT family N-acetyltransferase [Luteimonas deserti]